MSPNQRSARGPRSDSGRPSVAEAFARLNLEGMLEMSKRLQKAMGPFTEAAKRIANEHRRIQKSMEPFSEDVKRFADEQRRIQKSMEPFTEGIKRFADEQRRIQESMEPFTEEIKRFADAHRRIRERMEPLARTLSNLPEDARRVQRYLADRGWLLPLLDLPLAAAGELARMIDEGRHDEMELELQSFVRSHVEQIAQKTQTFWPHRWTVLADAFDAHRQGRYTLSVPAMLIQADGISQDLLGAPLFGKQAGAPKTMRALDQALGRIKVAGRPLALSEALDICLEPLKTVSSLGENTVERDRRRAQEPSHGPLNRHAVLHGLDVEYASEPNSLRAVLLLDYLASAKKILDTHREEAKHYERLVEGAAEGGPELPDSDRGRHR